MSAESERDDRIRALLAELGSGPEGERLPPAVAERLDDTLARLVAARVAAADPATTTSIESDASPAGSDVLPADRTEHPQDNVIALRRRWAARATAAAAAVIVLGAGGVTAANLWGGSSDSVSSAGAGEAQDSAGDSALEDLSGGSQEGEELGGKAAEAARSLPQVSSATFSADVAGLVSPARSGLTTPDPAERPSPGLPGLRCPGPPLSDGSTTRAVVYDGTLAALVVHPVREGRRLVEAWTCAGTRRLDAARIAP